MTELSTKERILSVACNLFYEKGVGNVGVEGIVQAAGVTKPTLYHYFKTKDHLVAAYLEHQDELVFSALTKAATRTKGGLDEKVNAIFSQIGKAVPTASWKGCPFLRTAAEFAGRPEHPAIAVARAHKQRFEAWLRDLLVEHGHPKAESTARQLVMLIDGAVAHAFLQRSPAYPKAASAAALQLISVANASRAAGSTSKSRPTR